MDKSEYCKMLSIGAVNRHVHLNKAAPKYMTSFAVIVNYGVYLYKTPQRNNIDYV